ncbi:hypothetical protein M4I32_13195 [Microbacterium sp. LRZ72]|uniref:hypothetical protein n=1 Tax=Microbacterium sp. LRZ72 TaxID=2942481 RepID=UPI0029BC85EE|nr:hypothetical protein [Microbacterium sp. LRZ72]MDX2377757.1 hypothetical protein [Microbacterium sp. LRZ72]
MIDRSDVEAVIARVAIAAFTYYPDRATAEPGYTLGEDVAWCAKPLATLDDEERDAWRLRIARLITDPAADKQSFIRDITALVRS